MSFLHFFHDLETKHLEYTERFRYNYYYAFLSLSHYIFDLNIMYAMAKIRRLTQPFSVEII